MEGDRQFKTLRAQERIRKQQQEIETLLKEQEELQYQLNEIQSEQQRKELADSLLNLIQKRDLLDEDIKKEVQTQRQLLKEITSKEVSLEKLRKELDIVSSNAGRQRTQKHIQTLEYKLNRAAMSLNEQLAKNRHLKDELQILYCDRINFQRLYHKLNRELEDVKQKIIEEKNLTAATEQARMESQSKMAVIREKEEKDTSQTNSKISKLSRVISHELNRKDYITIKCSKRSGHDYSRKEKPPKGAKLREDGGYEVVEDPQVSLKDAFETIQHTTGVKDLDLLVTKFIEGEKETFTVISFLNELSGDITNLEKEIVEIQEEIERLKADRVDQKEKVHSALIDTEEQEKKVESQAEEYETQSSALAKLLKDFKSGLDGILTRVEKDSAVIETLDSRTEITENNILAWMSLLEEKTGKLLALQSSLENRDEDKRFQIHKKFGPTPELPEANADYQTPYSNVELSTKRRHFIDDDEKPLSEEELRKRVLELLQKEPVEETGKKPS